MENNKQLFDSWREVPASAKKIIQGGKLKGMTDIRPMWRIEMLTQAFGPCGIGWKVSNIKYWTESYNGETAAFVTLDLFIKQNGEWSDAISGIGGSKMCGKGKGDGLDDEAYKMAYTDALSVCCKNLGMAADVYYGDNVNGNHTKYDKAPSSPAPVNKKSEYEMIVEKAAYRKISKSGKTYEQEYQERYHPSEQEYGDFLMAVSDYRQKHNLQ